MNTMPGQGFSGENGSQSIDGPDDIILGDHEQWKQIDPSPWELEEDERNLRRENDVSVQQWLQGQDNSQPAQDTFLTSQSLPQRKRETQKLLVRIDDVFKPSSVQTAESSNNTALGLRNPTTSNITTASINKHLLNNSPIAVPSLQQFSASSDRNTRYGDNGYHGARVSSTLAPQSRSAFPIPSHGHQASGDFGQALGPSFQRTIQGTAWSVAGTDTSVGSKKPPKRQNSHSTDDDTNSKRTFPRRNRSRVDGQSFRGPPPSGSGRTTQSGGNALLQTPMGSTQGPQHQIKNNTSPLISEGSSLPGTQQNRPLPDRADKVLSQEDFNDVSEICPFWLFNPTQFANIERQACCGRKEEVSHIITHLTDHHGLVRGKDPKNPSRKYLTSCQTHNPSVKAKGDCSKCNSLHKWKGPDFTDPVHKGNVVCLRCWLKFDKKGMQSHLAGPMCPYNSEQPKPKKMCILYTTFCSNDKPPSPPPKNMAPRKTKPRSSSKRHNSRNITQQVERNPVRQPAPEQTSQLFRPSHSQPPHSEVQPNSTHGPSFSTSSQTQSFVKRDVPTSHESHGSQNRQPVSGNSFTRQQADIHQQPNHQPIALIYPDTPPEYIADIYKRVRRDREQGVARSTYSPMARPSSFENNEMDGTMVENGFQQQTQSEVQNGLRLTNQYQSWPPSFLQVPQAPSQLFSQTLGQTSQRGLQDKSFNQFSRQSLTQAQYPQRSSSQHLLHEYLSAEHQQQSSTNANLSAYNGGNPQLRRSSNTPQLQLQVSPMNDLDATISLSGGLSHVPSSPSRVPSTAGESMCFLQSPNIDGPMWLLDNFDYEGTPDWLNIETVGSHPQLQESIEVGSPPPVQPQQRVKDLEPDSRLLTVQQTAAEKDSGYHSDPFNDIDWDANKMFS